MDINDIIDSIYKLPDASKEALLSDAPEVAYPKGFHLFRANHKSSKFYLMKKGMLHAYTHQSDKKVTFWFGKEGDALFMIIGQDMRILNFWKIVSCMNSVSINCTISIWKIYI